MNWREKLNYKPYYLLGDNIRPGMIAKLLVGDEKAWTEGAWIIGMKGKSFEVIEALQGTSMALKIKLPYEDWDSHESDRETEEAEERGYWIVRGDKDWFEYKEA